MMRVKAQPARARERWFRRFGTPYIRMELLRIARNIAGNPDHVSITTFKA
ncbi:hypothetical protein [Sphingobium amiense]|nr:hypothetical protein [Sphingobium amiense]